MIPTFVVIPTRGRSTLDDCVCSVSQQVNETILIDTSADGVGWHPLPRVRDVGDRNISRWWNHGLLRAARMAHQQYDATEWNVLVLNDDVIVPPGWVHTMTSALREGTADLAYPATWHKITGYAFVLRGESRIRADESLVWWYGDDDIQFQAEASGGVVTVDAPVEHRHPDEDTQADPELVAQTHLDAKTFEQKWGRMP